MTGQQLRTYMKALRKERSRGVHTEIDRISLGSYNYSAKYKEFIKNVIKAKEDGKKVFAYIRNVNAMRIGSSQNCENIRSTDNKSLCYGGLIVLKKLLKNKKISFSVIEGNTKESDRKKRLERYNRPNNARGGNIQLLIGTSAAKEGITLKDVQEVHVLQPEWNYSGLDQVLGRTLRANSHKALIEDLKKEEKEFTGVDVFLYAAIPDQEEVKKEGKKEVLLFKEELNSLDLHKYVKNVTKDKEIAKVRQLLKETAIDCPLFYRRNVRTVENSRDCNYGACDYECRGFSDMNLIDKELPFCSDNEDPPCITSENYNEWYDEAMIKKCISVISDLMRSVERISDGSYYIDSLVEKVRNMVDDVSKVTVLKTIDKMITEKTRVNNSDGLSMALAGSGDKLFLSGSLQKVMGSSRGIVLSETGDPEYMNNVGDMIFSQIVNSPCENILLVLDVLSPVMKLFILKESVDISIKAGDDGTDLPNVTNQIVQRGEIKGKDDIWTLTFSYLAYDPTTARENERTVKAYRTKADDGEWGRWCGNEEANDLDETIDVKCFDQGKMEDSLDAIFVDILRNQEKYFMYENTDKEQFIVDLSKLYDEEDNLWAFNILKIAGKKRWKEKGSLSADDLKKNMEGLVSIKNFPGGQSINSWRAQKLKRLIETLCKPPIPECFESESGKRKKGNAALHRRLTSIMKKKRLFEKGVSTTYNRDDVKRNVRSALLKVLEENENEK